ncbi:MAG: FMN-binding protein [Spirochaetaceae bacterium]|jgi:major membrane immunogen (membrane-anchored lipoprotein)|nr:FMN-binding protein [Spirochaetaceae bacterium]
MKKAASVFLRLLLCAMLTGALASCAKKTYRDGVYFGKSGPDEKGAWGEVTVTIKDGRVSDCAFLTRQKDGSVKGGDYGKINGAISNQDYYNKAQLAVRAMDEYARVFRETGDLGKVDAVSGATNSFNQFIEAVDYALDAASP